MSRFWSPIVSQLSPYTPGEQPTDPRVIKLNTNENPYGPSPRALSAMIAEIHAKFPPEDVRAEVAGVGNALRLYPDPEAAILCAALARHHAVPTSQIFVGNGSDEVLAHTFAALLDHGAPVLFPDVTYSFFPTWCKLHSIAYRLVPLAHQFELRVADYQGPLGGIILANPNAPTGRAVPSADLAALVRAHSDVVVVVDEAYIDFGGETVVPLVATHPNLLVVRTFSKGRSLAGLRVGYAIGDEALIGALKRVKSSFNSYPLDRLAIVGATAAVEDTQWFEKTRSAVMTSRTRLTSDLESLGCEVIPSSANFAFARHPRIDGATLAADLRAMGILVRHFKLPRIEQYLRITVGTDAQCEALVHALRKLIDRA